VTSPTAQRVADGLRLSLVAGVGVLPLIGRGDDVWGMVYVAVGAAILRLARAPAGLDLAFVSLLAADAWLTALGAFDEFNNNDRIGHLLLPAAVTPVLAHLAARIGIAASGPLAAGVSAASLTIALGTVWELVEYGSDELLGTEMSLSLADTTGDLAADVAGALAGAVLVVAVDRRAGPAT